MLKTYQNKKGVFSIRQMRITACMAFASVLYPAAAGALPQDGIVSGGVINIVSGTNRLDINQSSNKGIIDWSSFNINPNEAVRFNQPGSGSVTLNRIHDQSPSQIQGNVSANGTVMLINPNGVVFGAGAQVDVGGLVATTSDISNENFMNGNMKFDHPGNHGASIINNGNIKIADTGLAAFVAPGVSNNGVIAAKLGKVQLASGETFTLDMYGDGLLTVAATAQVQKRIVENTGQISADGGTVLLTAADVSGVMNSVVKNSGTIEANNISMQKGKIVLSADTVTNTGKLKASSGSIKVKAKVSYDDSSDAEAFVDSDDDLGGDIDIEGDAGSIVNLSGKYSATGVRGGNVTVTGGDLILSGAHIDASGENGGGTIRLGGDYQGKGALQHAQNLTVDKETVLKADALNNGNGGKIINWSDVKTIFEGTASARGGDNGGNGGLIEVSSHLLLNTNRNAHFDTRAPHGKFGDILFDPSNVDIYDGGSYSDGNGQNGNVGIDPAFIVDTLDYGNVTITADQNINIYDRILGGGPGTLTFQAGGDITVGAMVLIGGAINFVTGGNFNNNSTISAPGGWSIYAIDSSHVSLGGLSYNTKLYSCNFNGMCPGLPSGNGVYYSTTPTVTIVADSISRTYGDSDPAFTYHLDGLIDGDTDAAFTHTASLTSATNSSSGTGSYTLNITRDMASGIGYNVAYTDGSLTINPLAITLSIDSQSKNYGSGDPGFTYTTSGVINGDDVGATIGRDAGENAGSYGIHLLGLMNSNYTISSSSDGTLTINPLALTVLIDNQSKTFGDSDPTLSYSISGTINGDDAGISTYRDMGENVGGYTIHVGGPSNGNYYISSLTEGTLSIGQRGISVNVDSFSKTYGDSDPSFSGSYSGTVGGENPGLQFSRSSGEGVGDYTITAGLMNGNYYISSGGTGNLYISPFSIDLVIADASKVYGDSDPIFTYSVSQILPFGESSPVNISLTRTSGENVGNNAYYITGTGTGSNSGNYTINNVTSGYFSITPKGLTITADNTGKTYGDFGDPSLTYQVSGLVGMDDAGIGMIYRDGGESAGNYIIHAPSSLNNSNYYIASATDGTFFLSPKQLTLHVNDSGKTYGDSQMGETLNYGIEGLINGESDPIVGVSIYRDVGENAGSYTIRSSGGFSFNSNYSLTSYIDGTFTISAAPIIVNIDSISKIYGDSDPMLTYSANTYNGENAGVNITRTSGENAGSYTITSAGLSNSNYYIMSINDGSLTITPRDVTISADYKTKVYGDSDPTLTYTVSGTINGEDAQIVGIAINRDGTESVGTYTITPGGGYASNGNYQIASSGGWQNSTFDITPRPISVMAGMGGNKIYGDTEPTLDYTANTINGEDAGITLMRDSGENVGGYGVHITGLTNSNYTIDYGTSSDGYFYINPRSVTLLINSGTKNYGDSDPMFGYSVSGTINGEDAQVNIGRNSGEDVGDYAITGSLSNSNYAIDINSSSYGSLRIDPRLLDITIDSYTKTYGDLSEPMYTYTLNTNLIGMDSVVIGVSRVSGENAGNYAITLDSISNSNYTAGTITNGTLTINPKSLIVTADDQTVIYGDTNYAWHVDGLIGMDGNPIAGLTFTPDDRNVGVHTLMVSGGYSNDSNYTFDSMTPYVSGVLTINQRGLDIIADYKTKVYGTVTDPTLTYTVNGLQYGDADPTNAATIDRDIGENAGYYNINLSGDYASADGNYFINTYTANVLEITPYALTITADNKSKTYGDANPAFTYTVNTLNGDANPLSGVSLTSNSTGHAGTFTISSSGGSSSTTNYIIGSRVGGTFTIDPKAITVAADAKSKTYGAADPGFTYQLSGLVGGDNALVTGVSLNSNSTGHAGTYTITASGGSAGNGDYTIGGYTTANYVINSKALTVIADAKSKTYGDADPGFTYQLGGLVGGDNALVTGVSLSSNSTGHAGTHTITASGGSAGNADYTIGGYTTGAYVINSKALTVIADAKSKTYGAADPGFTYQLSGLIGGDDALVSGVSLGSDSTGHAGSYTITASGGSAANNDYTIGGYTTGAFVINSKALTVIADAQSKTYGAADPGFTYQLSGLIGGDDALVSGVSLGSDSTGHAGSYTITASGGSAANTDYTIGGYTTGAFVINSKALTVIADAQSKTYGAADPGFTYQLSGVIGGDNALVTGVSLGSDSTGHAGSYTITASGGSAGNSDYTIGGYTSGAFVINSKALTVIADAKSKTYGAADPGFTYQLSGLVGGDDALVTGVSLGSDSTGHAGSYTITASGGSAANTDYTIGGYTSGAFVINSKALTIIADAKSKTYGAADPSFTYQLSGVVGGDDAQVTGVSLSSNSTGHAGTHTITATGGSVGNNDYTIGGYTGGAFVINSKALTVIADAKSKTYGDADPGFTYQLSGLIGGEDALVTGVSLSSNSNGHAGTHTITASGGSAGNSDYTISSYTTANYVINSKALTVIADAKSKTYGAADPNLTYQLSGLVGSDDAQITGVTLGSDSTGHAGSYTITASGGSVGNNDYTIGGYNTAAYTIGQKLLTIVADAKSKVYGAIDPAFTYQLSGLVSGDVDPVSGLALTSNSNNHVGTFTISGSGAISTNADYNIAYATAAFTITPAQLAVTINNATREYGAANPSFSSIITGYVNGDNSNVVTTLPTYATNANTNSNTGTYNISGSGAIAADYIFSYLPGIFTITASTTIPSPSATPVITPIIDNLINRMSMMVYNIAPVQTTQPAVIIQVSQPETPAKSSDANNNEKAANVTISNSPNAPVSAVSASSEETGMIMAPDGTFQEAHNFTSSLVSCQSGSGANAEMCH